MLSKRKATDNEIELPAKFSRIDEVISRGNNSLMQLNEIGIKGLRWNIEQISNMFPQRFRATCTFGEPFTGFYEVIPSGSIFYCEGSSKSICKHEIANQIMDRLTGKNDVNDSPVKSSTVNNSLPNLDQFYAKPTKNNEIFKADSAVRILNEKIRDLIYNFTLKEDGYCCHVSFRGFVFKGMGTSKKAAKREVAIKILQKVFKILFSENNSKKADEDSVNLPIDQPQEAEDSTIPQYRQKNFSNFLQSMVKNGFEKLVSTLDVQYSKRKVLAGIVMSRKLKVVFPQYCVNPQPNIDPEMFSTHTGWQLNPDESGEILKLIAISSGTKCLSGSEINSEGLVINDCHAEVISKRALQFFILKLINRLQYCKENPLHGEMFGCDIIEQLEQGCDLVYRVKDDVKFHLYISSPPCGDSRIFLPQGINSNLMEDYEEESLLDESNEDLHPNRKNRGLLRTKIECGEGTIPIKVKHIQTWDGILGGERLLTMSCSDKVCVWNVLGMQGALLSNVLSHPIYMDSLTIGSLFHQEHLERALYERAQGVTLEEDWWKECGSNGQPRPNEDVEQGELKIAMDSVNNFMVNKPHILTVTEPEERCPGKASNFRYGKDFLAVLSDNLSASNFSVNWMIGEDLEIISTAKGIKVDDAPSRLCKRNLFQSFLSIFKWTAYLNSESGFYEYSEMKSLSSSADYALGSANYQKKKIALYKFFDKQDFGLWIGKPVEQDWFGLKLPTQQ